MGAKYWKDVKFDRVYGTDTLTPTVAIVWTKTLVTPKDPPPPKEGEEPGKPRYCCSLLLDKENKEHQLYKEAIELMAKEMLPIFNKGRKVTMALGEIFDDGDSGKMDLEKYPFYAGKWFIEVRNRVQPQCVGRNPKEPFLLEDLHGGMLVRANVQPHLGASGVAFKVKAIQYWEDTGDRFGGGARDAVSLFEDCDSVEAKDNAPIKKDATKVFAKESEEEEEIPEVSKAKPKVKKEGKAALVDLL